MNEIKKELESIRARLIELRNKSLLNLPDGVAAAVGISHAIRALYFAIEGKEFEEMRD